MTSLIIESNNSINPLDSIETEEGKNPLDFTDLSIKMQVKKQPVPIKYLSQEIEESIQEQDNSFNDNYIQLTEDGQVLLNDSEDMYFPLSILLTFKR